MQRTRKKQSTKSQAAESPSSQESKGETKPATSTRSSSRSAAAAKAKGKQGRRFSTEQKQHALTLVVSGMKRTEAAKAVGTTVESLRRWQREAEAEGQMPVPPQAARPAQELAASEGTGRVLDTGDDAMPAAPVPPPKLEELRSPYAPQDPGQGLGDHEVAAILQLKGKHPSMGPAQIRAQLKRFKGWRLSVKAIARVLRRHGYELLHRGGRPEGPDPVRFEAPHPNALWQADFAEVRVGVEKLHVLIVLDDFSRFVPGYAVADSPTSEVAIETMKQAIARHGKPEAVRTDRGGAFTAKEFGEYLEAELIDHIVGRPYHPQGGGKVESAVGTLKRELWEVFEFHDRHEAERGIADFFVGYNEKRAHMGIDGLTPADRYWGRAERVLAAIDAVSRKRQGALAMLMQAADPFEEIAGAATGAPMEVLRLVIVEGVMELRFCGSRVRLGRLEN